MEKTRIMIFGTFDGVHRGHLNLFKQARCLAKKPYLIVSIARDVNVKKIKNHKPDLNEKERMALVGKSKLVDKVVLSGKNKYLPHILKEKPDIIALGYDQKDYVQELKKDLKNLPRQKVGVNILIKIIRLKPFKEYIYKNHLLKK